MPLGFALKMIGAAPSDVRWQEASGTIWKGELSGVSLLGQYQLGDVNLAAKPFALFGGEVGYRLAWAGDMGRARGDIFLGRDMLRISGLDVQVNFAGLVDLMPEIRNTNGVVSIANGSAYFEDRICIRASGDVSTDALTKLALQYNVTATDLTGTLSCLDDALHVEARGQLAQSDRVVSQMRLPLNGISQVTVTVDTDDAVLGFGLLRYGFQEEEGGYIFQRELNLAPE